VEGQQYALPLCTGILLAVDASYTRDAAQTPAPTTLWVDCATPEDDAATRPVYPAEAVAAREVRCKRLPCGAVCDAVVLRMRGRMSREDFGTLSAGTVYSRFVAKKCASAL
jgi:hypothetical protein